MADVAISKFTAPGAGALFGDLVDGNSNGIFMTGYNKSLSNTIIDIGSGALGNKIGANGYNSIKPYLKNGFEKGLFNSVVNLPASVLGVGLNKSTK